MHAPPAVPARPYRPSRRSARSSDRIRAGTSCATLFGPVMVVAALMAEGIGDAAHAQQPPSYPVTDRWSFTFAPYIWAAGMKGQVSTIPAAPPASIDVDFEDILEHIDIAFMGIGEVRKGRFALLADLTYLKVSDDASTPGPLFSGADAEVKTFIGTFERSYRAVAGTQGHVDVLVGARVWSMTTELSLKAGLLQGRERDNSETWVDPVVGAQVRLTLGSGFYLTAIGNVGGFGVASDMTWDILGGLGYQANDWFAPVIGYRHVEVDYEQDEFLFDVEMSGPLIGGVFRF